MYITVILVAYIYTYVSIATPCILKVVIEGWKEREVMCFLYHFCSPIHESIRISSTCVPGHPDLHCSATATEPPAPQHSPSTDNATTSSPTDADGTTGNPQAATATPPLRGRNVSYGRAPFHLTYQGSLPSSWKDDTICLFCAGKTTFLQEAGHTGLFHRFLKRVF